MAASATVVSLHEYLKTAYRPDRDFLEGELVERNIGEQPHARIQTIISSIFEMNSQAWGTRTSTELRVQVRTDRFRVPDICVLRRSDPFERIVTRPPLICIEVVSPGDYLTELQLRMNDYATMGVQNLWIVDPGQRAAYIGSTHGFERLQDGVFRVEGTPIVIELERVFAKLDDDMSQ